MRDPALTTESSHDRPIGARGALLQQLLQHVHMTQIELAHQVNIDPSMVCSICLDRWVPGKSACTRDTIMAMARVMLDHGAPWPETMTWVVACGYSPFPPGEWRTPSFLHEMDPELREAALEAARGSQDQSRQVAALVHSYMATRSVARQKKGA